MITIYEKNQSNEVRIVLIGSIEITDDRQTTVMKLKFSSTTNSIKKMCFIIECPIVNFFEESSQRKMVCG